MPRVRAWCRLAAWRSAHPDGVLLRSSWGRVGRPGVALPRGVEVLRQRKLGFSYRPLYLPRSSCASPGEPRPVGCTIASVAQKFTESRSRLLAGSSADECLKQQTVFGIVDRHDLRTAHERRRIRGGSRNLRPGSSGAKIESDFAKPEASPRKAGANSREAGATAVAGRANSPRRVDQAEAAVVATAELLRRAAAADRDLAGGLESTCGV